MKFNFVEGKRKHGEKRIIYVYAEIGLVGMMKELSNGRNAIWDISYCQHPDWNDPESHRLDGDDMRRFRKHHTTLARAKQVLCQWIPENIGRMMEPKKTEKVRFLPRNQDTDFYPTPPALAGIMLSTINFRKVRVSNILEPSAGKGDLCASLISFGRRKYNSFEIDCIESDPNLRLMLTGAGYRVVADDFLRFRTNKCYDLILMNPPFRNGAEHLLHAIELLPMGGQIVCLLNAETIRNPYSKVRKELIQKLSELNAEIRFVPYAFRKAERKTDVEAAVIHITVPQKKLRSNIMEQLQKAKQESDAAANTAPTDLVGGDWVSQLIVGFQTESDRGRMLIEEYTAMMPYMISDPSYPNSNPLIELLIDSKRSHIDGIANMLNGYQTQLRMKYWRMFFHRPEITSRLTTKLQEQYHQMVGDMQDYDFSEYNIRRLMTDISANLSIGVRETILDLFETFTSKYTYAEFSSNIHYYNGWTTNKAHKVTDKVIVPFYNHLRWDGNLDVYTTSTFLKDLEQSLRYLDGGLPIQERDLSAAVQFAAEHPGRYPKVETTYFSATFYRKGTCHIKFKPETMPIIDRLNIIAGKEKKWLPPCYGKVHYASMDDQSKAVIDSFQGKDAYEKVMDNPALYLDELGELPLLADVKPA